MAEINSKREFFALWEAGVLGNRTLLWRDISEIPLAVQKVGFRELGKTGGGAWELVPRFRALETFLKWKSLGRNFIMDGSVPNEQSVMQGEVCRTEKGLQSFLAVGSPLAPMRQTIAAGLHRSYGYLETRVLLNTFMCPSSRDDLDSLLELYPTSAVEFTCFRVNVGVFPSRNTIFWEVRNY